MKYLRVTSKTLSIIFFARVAAGVESSGDNKAANPPCAAAIVLPFNTSRRFDTTRTSLDANPACVGRFHEIRTVPGRPQERLTIGYLYYRDMRHLEHNVQLWNSFPASILDQIHFLIVDDGSPDGERAAPVVAANVESSASAAPASRLRAHDILWRQEPPVGVTVLAIDQDLQWNIGGARNLLFATAPTDAIFLLDMDVQIPSELIEWALEHLAPVRASCVVVNAFRRHRPGCVFPCPHPAVMLVSKQRIAAPSDFFEQDDPLGNYRGRAQGLLAPRRLRRRSSWPVWGH